MMRTIRYSLVIAAASLATGILYAAAPPASQNLSHAELEKMIRGAHTPAEYKTLADYYRTQQQGFEQQAQTEKQEWERRSQNVTGPAAKYPRPVDSSRNRYEYFTYEAQQASQQAAHYEGLSASVAQ
jgi:hypothetical protein